MYSREGRDFYRTGSFSEKDRRVYELSFDFLRTNNGKSLNMDGFTLMNNIDGGIVYGFFHHEEGFSLVIQLHRGSKTFKLEVAGEGTKGRKRVAKTLMDLIGLKLKDEKIILK
jgi:hypothetical protein